MEDRHHQLSAIGAMHSSKPPASKPPVVVGRFCIEQQCYLIVAHVNDAEELLNSDLFTAAELSATAERIPLVVNGESCMVVEIQQTVPEVNCRELLSDRELQIAQLVAQGQSNKQIAQALQISKWTVLTHLRRIFSKLNVDSRAAMVYQLCGNDLNRNDLARNDLTRSTGGDPLSNSHNSHGDVGQLTRKNS